MQMNDLVAPLMVATDVNQSHHDLRFNDAFPVVECSYYSNSLLMMVMMTRVFMTSEDSNDII